MKENEIRPKKLLEKYIKLSSQDAKEYFNDDVREDINCVACGIDDNAFAFEKYNFKYALCNSCGTLLDILSQITGTLLGYFSIILFDSSSLFSNE